MSYLGKQLTTFQYWKNIIGSNPAATTCYPAGIIVDAEREVMIKLPTMLEPVRK